MQTQAAAAQRRQFFFLVSADLLVLPAPDTTAAGVALQLLIETGCALRREVAEESGERVDPRVGLKGDDTDVETCAGRARLFDAWPHEG